MIVRPYLPGDEREITLQSSQTYIDSYLDGIDFEPLSKSGTAWTAEHEGDIIAIGGILPVWENRAQVWSLISENAGRHMISIHKEVEKGIIQSPYRRLEATVDVGFKQGIRWIKMLGFELEGYMKAYRPDGGDMLLFARVVQ